MLGSRARRTDPDGVDVGELGDDEGPGAHVQADQPQRLDGGGDPQVAEEAVAGDQAAVLPAVQHVAQGGLAEQALDPGGAGREPAEQDAEDVGAGGVLLAEPAQGGDVAVGDAGVGVPARPPRVPAPGRLRQVRSAGPWTLGPGRVRPARKKPSSGTWNLRVR